MCGFCAGHGCSNHDTSGDTSDGEDYTSGSDEDERSTSAEKTTTLVDDKMKVGFILFYSICLEYDWYTICLASANQMKVNNQH